MSEHPAAAMVELQGVTKRFGSVLAVDDITLVVRRGELLTLLGPSGCGKTTLLRLLAGFEVPDRGSIFLEGADVTRLPPYRRDVNQVFQSYALFPHLTVRENIGFGLRMQGIRRKEADLRIEEAVKTVSLSGLEGRFPHQLSGGQRQRVALARAIICRPRVLLLDEPLSALDAKLRHGMQLELKHLQRRLGLTCVFVTHDQQEALTISDRIAIINKGRIEQLGASDEIYHRPRTAFAADFIGQANLFQVQVLHRGPGVRVRLKEGLEWAIRAGAVPPDGDSVLISIRPERIMVSMRPIDAENQFEARIEEKVFQGAADRLSLVTEHGVRLRALVTHQSAIEETLREGDQVFCGLRGDDLVMVEGG